MVWGRNAISIHALLAESDNCPRVMVSPTLYFYPRSPCGERPGAVILILYPAKISIHALLAESDVTVLGIQHRTGISIHALLAESDRRPGQTAKANKDFYPRSPCGERRFQLLKDFSFLPIISIHALLAESDHNTKNNCIDCCISIHALLAESDKGTAGRINGRIRRFLSTLSLRRATVYGFCTACVPENISIHALLAESDDRK